MTSHYIKLEQYGTALTLISGAIAAAVVAPWDSTFLAIFAWFWLPKVVVLALLLCLVPPHYSFFGGVSASLTIYFLLFAWWMHLRYQQDGMAWLGYLYSLPGAAAGAALSRLALFMKPGYGAFKVWLAAALGSLIGLGLNQIAVCSTIFYCLG